MGMKMDMRMQWTAVESTVPYIPSHFYTPPCEDSLAIQRGMEVWWFKSQLRAWNVHNEVTQVEEANRLERLCEEIGIVIRSRDKWND